MELSATLGFEAAPPEVSEVPPASFTEFKECFKLGMATDVLQTMYGIQSDGPQDGFRCLWQLTAQSGEEQTCPATSNT